MLLDLRQDRSSREQEEMGVGRNSRRESLAESSERRKGESRGGLNVCACEMKVRLNKESLDTSSGDWNRNWRPKRVEFADIDLDSFCSCEGFVEPFEEVRVELLAGAEG